MSKDFAVAYGMARRAKGKRSFVAEDLLPEEDLLTAIKRRREERAALAEIPDPMVELEPEVEAPVQASPMKDRIAKLLGR